MVSPALSLVDTETRAACLVPNGFAVVHHSHDPLLGLRMHEQTHERLALERQDPSFVDEGSRVDIAPAHDLGDRLAEMHIVLGDETAFLHVDELRHDGRRPRAPGDGETLHFERWTI